MDRPVRRTAWATIGLLVAVLVVAAGLRAWGLAAAVRRAGRRRGRLPVVVALPGRGDHAGVQGVAGRAVDLARVGVGGRARRLRRAPAVPGGAGGTGRRPGVPLGRSGDRRAVPRPGRDAAVPGRGQRDAGRPRLPWPGRRTGGRAGGIAGAAVVGGVLAACPLFVDYADQSRPYAMAWSFAVLALAAAVAGPRRAEVPPAEPATVAVRGTARRFWFWSAAILMGLSVGSRVEMLTFLPVFWWARAAVEPVAGMAGGRRPDRADGRRRSHGLRRRPVAADRAAGQPAGDRHDPGRQPDRGQRRRGCGDTFTS